MRPTNSNFNRRAFRRGFTLLEMCMVLFIIALLAGVAMPAMDSAFNERSLRNDGHALSLMAKTAMIKSSEEQRPYLIRLQGRELLLEPAPATIKDDAAKDAGERNDEALSDNSSEKQTLSNPLKFPDAKKKNTWDSLPSITWTFQPNSLCPLPRLRFEHGQGYLEMSFNALTGDVEDEAYYLP